MQKCIQYGLCLGILLFFAASLLSLGLSLSVQPTATAGESVSLPVLMYHSILDSKAKAGKYTIPPAVLEQDLQYLREHGYTSVSPEELIAYARGEGSLPEKPVLLTFDDGYYNNYSYVYPLLETYDMRAVISVVGSFTEQYSAPGAVMNNNYSHLNWAQLREMLDSGRVTLGNHSYDMHSEKTRLGFCRVPNESEQDYVRKITENISHMQRLVRENLSGYTMQVLTYPYGAYNKLSEQIARDLGFSMTLTCYEKVNTVTFGEPDTLFGLGRYNRPYGVSTQEFMRCFGGD